MSEPQDAHADVERRLMQAGWSERRNVPTSRAAAALERGGYPSWPKLLAMEAEFSGLLIPFVHAQHEDSIWFDIERACCFADREWVHSYEDRTNTPLAPIGGALNDHLLIMAGEDGRIFGGFDESLSDLGGTVAEAIANVLAQRWTPVAEKA